MTYPVGAGPEAGAFMADPAQPAVAGGQPQVAPLLATTAAVPLRVNVDARLVSGKLTAILGPAPLSGWWIRRIAPQASAVATLRIYTGLAATGYPDTVTFAGDGDEWEAVQPLPVLEGESLFLVWDLAAGTAGARIHYEEMA